MYARDPKDLEAYCSIVGGGEESFDPSDYESLYERSLEAEPPIELVEVIDAECEFVCVAPRAIAELIVRLLNECEEIE